MNGFDFKLTINKIDTVTPRQAGDGKNDDGSTFEWGWAVKFSSRNISLVDDDDFGSKEVETLITIEVPCDSKAEAVNVNEFLLKQKIDTKPFLVDVSLPSKTDKGYKTKTKLKGTDFIKLFERK